MIANVLRISSASGWGHVMYVADGTNLPSIPPVVNRHSIFCHISPVWQHTSTQGTEARRECKVQRHSTSRLESSSWTTTDLMD